MRLEPNRVRVRRDTGRPQAQTARDEAAERIGEESITRRFHVNLSAARSIVRDDAAELKTVSPVAAERRNDDATVGADEIGEPNALAHPDHQRRAKELVLENLGIDSPSSVD